MTEAEWETCERPELLLRHLKAIGVTRWRRGERRRKLRLLGCAAFGQARHLLRPEYGQRAIELAERYADGTAELTELHQLNQELRVTKMETGTPRFSLTQIPHCRSQRRLSHGLAAPCRPVVVSRGPSTPVSP